VNTLGIQRVIFLPWDAKSAAAMNSAKSGALRTAGFRLPPLVASGRTLARQLAGLHQDGSRAGDMAGDRLDENTGSPLAGQIQTGPLPVLGVEEGGS
jgi:hypothetical protein